MHILTIFGIVLIAFVLAFGGILLIGVYRLDESIEIESLDQGDNETRSM